MTWNTRTNANHKINVHILKHNAKLKHNQPFLTKFIWNVLRYVLEACLILRHCLGGWVWDGDEISFPDQYYERKCRLWTRKCRTTRQTVKSNSMAYAFERRSRWRLGDQFLRRIVKVQQPETETALRIDLADNQSQNYSADGSDPSSWTATTFFL